MRYIHFQCLKQWIDSRKNLKNQPGIHSLIWKNFDCEICKTAYPYSFIYKNKRWDLHEPYRPEDKSVKYIVLESMKNERNSGRIVHTLAISDDKYIFKLGRGNESDVRVNDISVSRSHLKVFYKEGRFFMQDCNSKFGTLALVKNDMTVTTAQDKAIQIGRTMLNLSVKDNAGLMDNPPFCDKTAAKFFDRKNNEFLPMFGGVKISENIDDLPEADKIQNDVPSFLVHSNEPIMKGNMMPLNQYFR